MTPDKEIIVLGDVEMGGGNLTDDFIADKALAKLIFDTAKKRGPVDMIFNGDTFDFLKCPSQLNPPHYPRHITKDISLAKLHLIYRAHPLVFEAWRQFLTRPEKRIYFILGNHDHDLIYPEVQRELQRLLENKERVIFPKQAYEQHDIHVEHGHLYDFWFAINFEKLFLTHEGKSILNFPYASLGLISSFMSLKEQHPFLERIFPRPELLTHHRVIARKVNMHTFGYFFKSLAYYPFRFYSDPTYSFPTSILRAIYKRFRTFRWDVDNITSIFMNKDVPQKIIILGHIHEKRIARGDNRIIIHPGSWRDEYDFNAKTRELIPRSKRYIQIAVVDNKPEYQIIDLPMHRSILSFDNVIKDEFKYLKLAAEEEA